MVSQTDRSDDRHPAPEEERISPVSEIVEKTMPDADPDPEGLDDPEDDDDGD
jgi:hypothetical protein